MVSQETSAPRTESSLSLLAVAFLTSLVLLGIYLSNSFKDNNKSDYTFVFEKYGGKIEEVEYKYESVMINDVLYVDMNRLAEFAEMSVSGSEESMKYIVSDSHYLKFTNDTDYAIVNATKVAIPVSAIIGNGKCLVPYQVISRIVESGLEFSSDSSKNTVTIKRTTYEQNDIYYYEDVTFSPNAFPVLGAIQDTSNVDFEYNIDMTFYLACVDPADSSPYLLLVNPSNPLAASYIPQNMSQIPSRYTALGETYFLVGTAKEALMAMLTNMEKDISGSGIYVTSAYRSYAYQYDLFEQYVKNYTKNGISREEAEAKVLKTSARPGTSEHQSGLCVDFMTTSMTALNNDFENTKAFKWLSENAYKYGFILRYPKDTSATAHDYESWHYRFVGRDAATEMYFSNLCLEEYLEFI